VPGEIWSIPGGSENVKKKLTAIAQKRKVVSDKVEQLKREKKKLETNKESLLAGL